MDKSRPVIINLQSGTAKKKYKEIKDALYKKYTFEVRDSSEFSAVYKKVLKFGPKIIVLGGGDGTIIKGIESLVGAGYQGAFGILPLGTANYLARDIGLPLDASEALLLIKKGRKQRIPLAKVNDNLFALMMTIGVTRAVSSNIDNELKQNFGQMAYVAEFLRQAKTHEPFEYEIRLDRKKKLEGTTHQLLIYNADLNQQIKITPDHKLSDNRVRVLIPKTGRSITKLYLSFLLHILSFGRVRRDMKVYTARHVSVETKPVLPVGLDGEVVEDSAYEVWASALTIKIVC